MIGKDGVHRFKAWSISVVIWLYLWLVVLTSKLIVTGESNFQEWLDRGEGFIFALWHNRQLLLCHSQRNNNVVALVSRSRDGDFISALMSLFNIETIRGSSSKSGARALVSMFRALRKGKRIAITPDGPRGPVYEIQPGIVHLARKSGKPVVAATYAVKRKKIFNSWDHFLFPFPFNQIVVRYGEPVRIDPDESLETSAEKIKNALDQNTREAESALERLRDTP